LLPPPPASDPPKHITSNKSIFVPKQSGGDKFVQRT
jgi:hypothetical protein